MLASSRCLSAARRKPRPNSASSSNSEFDQAGPRPSWFYAPRRDGKIGAINRRAAGRIRDHHPVAEQLREELEIGRLAAAGAGAGELEQRLEKLDAAHIGEIHARAVVDRQALEERDIGALRLDQRRFGFEVDRLDAGIDRAVRRAAFHAQAAARAILDIELQGEADVGIAAGVDRRRFEGFRRAVEARLVVIFGADDAVRADEAALAALNAEIGPPDGHFIGDVALFPGGCAGRKGAVDRHEAHRNLVAQSLEHPGGHLAHELRRVRRHGGRTLESAGRLGGHR